MNLSCALRAAVLAATPLVLTACAVPRPPPQVEAPAPGAWQAPLPHGASLQQLGAWWQGSLHDALLTSLIDDAQALSPSVAQAASQLAQARAQQVAARSALAPAVDAQANASRGFNQQLGALASVAQVGVQAAWELDLFGANAAQLGAARQRAAAAGAQWHEARVSVAAEVAQQYTAWHACRRQLAVAGQDARSRGETARLSVESERAGFTAPATAALATASHADALSRAAQQQLQCEIGVKTLVALTGRPEPALRAQLEAAPPPRAQGELFAIARLPAQLLAQRPDVYAAEREVAAASAEVGALEAARYPRLQLLGSVGAGWVRTGGVGIESTTWSIGPVALSLPLFDAGRRAAQVDAARVRYDSAAIRYRAVARQAVAEVEQALARLASSAARTGNAQQAAAGYRRSFEATQARWTAGLASLVELEDARRLQLASDTALVALEQERMSAWIALYRAAGGGWSRQEPAPAAAMHAGAAPAADPSPNPPPGAGPGFGQRRPAMSPPPAAPRPPRPLPPAAGGGSRRRSPTVHPLPFPHPAMPRPKPLQTLVALAALVTLAGAGALLASGASHADTPAAAAAPRPALTVAVVQPQQGQVTERLAANGSIAAWQEASIGSEANGLRLTEVRVNVGDTVRAGQVLATFAPESVQAEVAQARASVLEARAAAAEAQANAERAGTLTQSGALSQQQIQQYATAAQTAQARVEAAQAQLNVQQLRLKRTQVLAPDSGVISARAATVGAVVGAGTELFRMVRRGRLEWRAEVGAAELPRIRPGQRVQVTAASGAQVQGTVRMLAPTVDPQTRNALVYVDLPQHPDVRAGMYARGEFLLGQRQGLSVPLSAVVVRDGFSNVFEVGGDGRVHMRRVSTGERSGQQVEILQGLAPTARVVLRGGSFLNDGDLVRIAPDVPPVQPNTPAAGAASRPAASN